MTPEEFAKAALAYRDEGYRMLHTLTESERRYQSIIGASERILSAYQIFLKEHLPKVDIELTGLELITKMLGLELLTVIETDKEIKQVFFTTYEVRRNLKDEKVGLNMICKSELHQISGYDIHHGEESVYLFHIGNVIEGLSARSENLRVLKQSK